jgi:hypothetical protein
MLEIIGGVVLFGFCLIGIAYAVGTILLFAGKHDA